MPLPKIYTTRVAGFSLVEMVVVFCLISIIAAVGVVTTVGSMDRYDFEAQKKVFIGRLEKARSDALNVIGVNGYFENVSADALTATTTIFSQSDRFEPVIIDPNGRISW